MPKTTASPHQRLREYREKKEWSLLTMANALNVSTEQVRRMEGGHVPTLRTLKTIRDLVGIPLDAWESP